MAVLLRERMRFCVKHYNGKDRQNVIISPKQLKKLKKNSPETKHFR